MPQSKSRKMPKYRARRVPNAWILYSNSFYKNKREAGLQINRIEAIKLAKVEWGKMEKTEKQSWFIKADRIRIICHLIPQVDHRIIANSDYVSNSEGPFIIEDLSPTSDMNQLNATNIVAQIGENENKNEDEIFQFMYESFINDEWCEQ
ncbi:18300_t:CDS:1 [Funneliformis geosporum]|uniref:17987_t:CDS:1 n=1 Tax=Funneliformis geosporum TaxID=1117311 RepID=A0A9W4WZW3_9GLOM|nr:18300_t:CDS:1 [Funneliformis geosporum]CAI2176028.1 17987_t:CDS:1 [Funneliformis geosporum]